MRAAALAVLSGVLYFSSYTGFDLWPLTWVAFVPVVIAIDGGSGRRGFLLGWLFGAVMHLGGFTWVSHMLATFGGLPEPLAFVGYVLFCIGHGLVYAVFGGFVARLSRFPLWATVPLSIVAAEQLVPRVFRHYTAAAQLPWLEVVQITEVGGIHAVGALVGLVNGALATLWLGRGRLPLLVASATVALCAGWGSWRMADVADEPGDTLLVGVAQNNRGGWDKHRHPLEAVQELQVQTSELAAQGAELVVWPEAAWSQPIPHDAAQMPKAVVGDAGVPLVVGALSRESRHTPIANTALLVDEHRRILGSYEKRALLIFGEYLPFGDVFPKLYDLVPTSRLLRGTSTASLVLDGHKLGVFICYEAILPEYVHDIMRDPSGPPDLLVNLTNDSWYGQGPEQVQHLALARLRSVELRRALVRSTNTGISAIVDATGALVAETENWAADTALAPVTLRSDLTLALRLGAWPGWLAVFLALVGSVRRRS